MTYQIRERESRPTGAVFLMPTLFWQPCLHLPPSHNPSTRNSIMGQSAYINIHHAAAPDHQNDAFSAALISSISLWFLNLSYQSYKLCPMLCHWNLRANLEHSISRMMSVYNADQPLRKYCPLFFLPGWKDLDKFWTASSCSAWSRESTPWPKVGPSWKSRTRRQPRAEDHADHAKKSHLSLSCHY